MENAILAEKKKARSAKFPQLDSMIMNFINKAESYLSEYGLGITWAIIQVKAKHFGKELNDRGLMTDEEYESFKFFDFNSEVNDFIDGVDDLPPSVFPSVIKHIFASINS